jgi:thymidylate synthase
MQQIFHNADMAFEYYYDYISRHGVLFDGTKAIFNVGIQINNPLDNEIKSSFRKWKPDYAQSEWLWYLTQARSVEMLGSIYGSVPKIWRQMADEHGMVNSNYGWQWGRNNQLNKVIELLKVKPDTRKAAISIYDGKEIEQYRYDTPCTYAVHFTILDNKLNMSVMMRSNDLWFGFTNDQYCFSSLQKLVATELKLEVGWYYHFVNNLHIYENQLNR